MWLSDRISDMTAAETQDLSENWNRLEQMKRLGYLSWLQLTNEKYQFDNEEIISHQPFVNISVFTKIGLIISITEGSIANQKTKYQFAHRTLQEYFAAMFIVKWENELRKKIRRDRRIVE